jgi:5-hydroxyisourate hydrolase
VSADATKGRLSLHVLDTARGRAGDGLAFTLARIDAAGDRVMLGHWMTDEGGRWLLDQTVIPLEAATYEVVFEADAYQRRLGQDSFYDRIAIRFRVTEPSGHYHIPLILSPYGYSTYRGG